jgi:DNA polymerase-3 subunit delta'
MSEIEEETADDRRHPRRRFNLVGHQNAEARLLAAYRSGKMHHGWIFGGPGGIGKATLAYRLARFILLYPDPAAIPEEITTLDVASDDPVSRRVAASGHSDLLTVTQARDPKTKKFKREIGVAEARKAGNFFTRTAGEGGWRICIVDPASALNATAANALLKTLEEPPERALFVLVSDIPGRLMATIRSRCVRLDLAPLSDSNVTDVLNQIIEGEEGFSPAQIQAAANWAKGSPGMALKMLQAGVHERLEEFSRLAASFPALDKRKALDFAEKIAARGADQHYLLFCDVFLNWLAGETRKRAISEPSLTSSASGALADAYQEIDRSLRRANALNLDKRQTILQALYRVERAWSQQAAA